MVHIICPNVEKHALKMMEELHQMKRENEHCDFIIQVGDDVYYTHKNVLSAGSDYFKAMLKHDTKESREGKIVFKDVDSKCVKNCIDFIYSGKFEIPDEKMNDVLYVATMMQLEDVKQAISDILEESITVENYFSTQNVADMYSLDAVSTQCRVFFQENIVEISNQPEFGNIEKNDIVNVMKSKKSKLCQEGKLTILLNWAEKNNKHEEHLHECLGILKFDKMSPAFLKELLKTHPSITHNFELYKFINDHLMEAWEGRNKIKNDEGNDELVLLFDWDSNCIRSIDPITDKVEKFHDEQLEDLKQFKAISLDSYIYVLCGDKSVHRLNCRKNDSKWEKMKDMIGEHGCFPCSVSFLGSIFVIGGSYPDATAAVERFDRSVNQWFQLENKPSAISYTSLVSLNDSIYCIGGKGKDDVVVSSFHRFTPSSSEWVELSPLKYPVWGSGVIAVAQKIFVVGGCNEEEVFNKVECYDVSSSQWTSLSSMNADHSCINAYHVSNWIFAISVGETSDDIEKYDVMNNKWCKVVPKVDRRFKIFTSTIVKL